MERHVKERLVGAAVLVAAAVILIPEMLSGPREYRNRQAASSGEQSVDQKDKNADAPLKTYTIDLSQSSTTATPAQDASPVVIEAAPPSEDSTAPETSAAAAPAAAAESATADQASPEPAPVENHPDTATAAAPAPAARPPEEPPTGNAVPPQRDVAPPATPPANREVSPPAGARPAETAVANNGKGWAVQLASFDAQSSADDLRKQWRDKGYEAFVMPFKKGGTTWYRVRLGPVKDRQAAGEILSKVKETTPGAIVVPHP